MLFSNDQVVNFIHKSFEPVWQSLRPVPILTLNFGNGHTVTRTLHGNVVTAVCTADGKVLDALPGLYAPKTYTQQLDQLWLLHAWLEKKPAAERETAWRDYHRTQAEGLQRNLPRGQFTGMDPSKMRVERSAKNLFITFTPPEAVQTAVTTTPKETAITKPDKGKLVIESRTKGLLAGVPSPDASSPIARDKDVARWQEILDDTKLNDQQRRLLIHLKLAPGAQPTPDSITKWLYAQVLHADLDDPYLGLKPLLQGDYPFKDSASH